LGTPDFMPPEQRRDAAEVDHRSDLWSLAATVYQMVTGRSPKIIRFDLSEDSSVESSMIFGELYRHNGEWKFKAVGQGFAGGLAELIRSHGVTA
jgi:stress response protein SCP2